MGHTLEGYVVGVEPYDQPKVIQNHDRKTTEPFGVAIAWDVERTEGLGTERDVEHTALAY